MVWEPLSEKVVISAVSIRYLQQRERFWLGLVGERMSYI